MELFQRVLSLKPYFGAKTKMAEVLGITPRMFDSYLKSSSQVHFYPLLPKLLKALPGLSREWLYFGEGEPNLKGIEVKLEDVQNIIPEQGIGLAEVVARQSVAIEKLTETNRRLTEQLLKQNLKDA